MTSFFIDQHGCAKNQTDGELMASFLEKAGYTQVFDAEKADFIFINSCGFINSAKKESIDAVCAASSNYPDSKIILTGCLAQRYADELFNSMPELSGVFGNGDISKIPDFMKRLEAEKRCVALYPQEGVCTGSRNLLFNYKASAFVKITEGCSNHCSFCAIPLIRGEVRSRPAQDIVDEIQGLVNAGVYEINLIGQDLAAYGTCRSDVLNPENFQKSPSPLKILLEKISELQGDFIVRLLYIHPDHFNKDILEVFKKDRRFVHYFDIPFQSGDDEIIKKMNRCGSQQHYLEMIENIRKELGECMIRTTFLTGFPGETDENAENTKKFLELLQPDWSGCFPYSREEDTPAYNLKNRVSEKIAKKRAAELEKIQGEITQKKLNAFVGRQLNVIIEEIIDSDENQDDAEGLAIGRGWFQAPEVDGCIVIRYDSDNKSECDAIKTGNVVKVQILAVTGVDLDSRFVSLEKEYKDNGKLGFLYK